MLNKKYVKVCICILLLALFLAACSANKSAEISFSAHKIEMDDINLVFPPDYYVFNINAYEIINTNEKETYSLVLKTLENGTSTEIWRSKLTKPDQFKTGGSRIFFNFTNDKFIFKEQRKLKSGGQSMTSTAQELDKKIQTFIQMGEQTSFYEDIKDDSFEKEALLFAVTSVDEDENFDSNDYSKFKGEAVIVCVEKE